MADKTLFEHHREYESNFEKKGAGVQLAESEYNGRQYFTLRAIWLTPDAQWRWSTVKPDSQGRHWNAVKLSEDEAKALYEALGKRFSKGAVASYERKRDAKDEKKDEPEDPIPF